MSIKIYILQTKMELYVINDIDYFGDIGNYRGTDNFGAHKYI